jgi:hypothetical protein
VNIETQRRRKRNPHGEEQRGEKIPRPDGRGRRRIRESKQSKKKETKQKSCQKTPRRKGKKMERRKETIAKK